jgi:hypothetical protein
MRGISLEESEAETQGGRRFLRDVLVASAYVDGWMTGIFAKKGRDIVQISYVSEAGHGAEVSGEAKRQRGHLDGVQYNVEKS